jgi:uncharacterized protein YegJ (DUF2314 family)
MKSRSLGLVFALAVVLVLVMVGSAVLAQGGDPVVNFSEDDVAMNDAMAAAKDSLPVFLDALNDPASGADSLILKVAISTETDYVEHIWVEQISDLGDGRFSGVYANQPVEFKANEGDPVTFTQASISDWSFMRGEQLHGNYTTRVMLPYIDPDYAAYLTSILAPLPEVTP